MANQNVITFSYQLAETEINRTTNNTRQRCTINRHEIIIINN